MSDNQGCGVVVAGVADFLVESELDLESFFRIAAVGVGVVFLNVLKLEPGVRVGLTVVLGLESFFRCSGVGVGVAKF